MVDRGGAIIGTPDDAVEAIGRLSELAGGFGTLVGFVHDWANHEQAMRSYDLFARYVIPRVQGLLAPVERSADMLRSNNTALMKRAGEGILKAIREHNAAHPRS
jgi:limonene 1,2-monooxygenase